MSTYRLIFILVCSLGLAGMVNAENVNVPNTFTAGNKAKAAEVNANFAELVAAINDLKAEVEELKTKNADLEEVVVALGEKPMHDLSDYIEIYHDSDSIPSGTATQGPLIRFTGANVQVVSGEGATDAAVNGVGNLIVGYDESRPQQSKQCSDGQYEKGSRCFKSNKAWKSSHKSGSHNLIVGANHNYSRYGGLVAGFQNSITGAGASVLGGTGNTAGFQNSTVTGSKKLSTTAANSSRPDYWADSSEARSMASQALNTANQAQRDAQAGIQRAGQANQALDGLYEKIIRIHPSLQ